MTLEAGTKLGSYEVSEPIGAGGMGEVYRARDTKLGRDVAIKVLPEEFARDKERLDRFDREARLLAQLNHPNIATLHGLEEREGQQFLVMELVEGETLAERIARGPLSVDESISLFIQIAEGLEAAHAHGMIHRDLKPMNVKITPEGKPKILDFGLAKAALKGQVSPESPTITRDGTETGVILGTAAYMSPEQARGQTLDKRTDIWSFGCVFFEALTGRPAFLRGIVSDTLAQILTREPEWERLPDSIPGQTRRLLHRCLEKDRARRQHDIADARLDIEESLTHPWRTESDIAKRPRLRKRKLWYVGVVLGIAISGLALWPSSTPREPSAPIRFIIRLPDDQELYRMGVQLAFSPDGRRIVYVGRGEDRPSQLWLRDIGQLVSVPLTGTEGAGMPFFLAGRPLDWFFDTESWKGEEGVGHRRRPDRHLRVVREIGRELGR